ncbi:6-carboxytetrahydropterin synthase QueD [Marinitoga aeolica]|uniref:6-carboxy-5,6,7,8-tetrahydropterin synthase n=1 Tax=Marinitoga aeolica TaxID=2809031 RepID=A0ABY8PPY9_9BACT|nr:6-carboxytetrahydropterin synthase QueD [Marinitoga aeolica]WGS64674.1 6-carboxytetrahydropterin synthase QueD [Marinitoga aeolica]
MLVKRIFNFAAAHNLVRYHGKCEALHGHNYRLEVTVEGTPNEEGMVIDFLELKKIVKDEVLNILDHSYINNIIEQPTAENISMWIWNKLEKKLKRDNCKLYEVALYETENNVVYYRGE